MSTHARASSAPVYLAMRQQAGTPSCDGCHTPLAAVVGPSHAAAAEGVTCEVCHAIANVSLAPNRATFELELGGNVKFGPHCDAPKNYFHGMGCSPLHTESKMCAACHQLVLEPEPGTRVPVFTEFEEWTNSEYPEQSVECQACHMSTKMGHVAVGWNTERSVSNHAMGGELPAADRNPLKVTANVEARGSALLVSAQLRNAFAGHAAPSGLPGKRIVLRVRAVDGQGNELDRQEVRFARVLVDSAGAEVPFYRAARVGSDNRLAAGELRSERLEVHAAGAGTLHLELVREALSAEVAASLGLPPPPSVVIASGSTPFGAPKQGRSRAHLPTRITLNP